MNDIVHTNGGAQGPDTVYEHDAFASDLQQRCEGLVKELEQFQAFLRLRQLEHTIELRAFRNEVSNELKLIRRLRGKTDGGNPRSAVHALKSSNFPFQEATWATIKNSESLLAVRKRFYWDGRQAEITQAVPPRRAQHSIIVDVVDDEGRRWTKISTITEKRMLLDLAKAGWPMSDSDEQYSDDDDRSRLNGSVLDDDDDEGLFKQMKMFARAARANKAQYVFPRLHLILTRISTRNMRGSEHGDDHPVLALLDKIRALGIHITTCDDLVPPVTVEVAMPRMAHDPQRGLSAVLNVDCTLLLAFVSDLSHGQVESQHWHHRFLARQMEMEAKCALLPTSLWPVCAGRELICTREAATRMCEIVEDIGTPTERERTRLLLEPRDGAFSSSTTGPLQAMSQLSLHDDGAHDAARLDAFQRLSAHAVPGDWHLPIRVIDVDIDACLARLPASTRAVATATLSTLSPLNRSVFLHGWAHGLTTVSSNRHVVKELRAAIEARTLGLEIEGPRVWLAPVSRSLVGKEKERRGAVEAGADEVVGEAGEMLGKKA